MACGISAISKEFTPFFFGKGYDECIRLIIALSPVLVIKGLSEIARMQYLIPNHKEKIFIESVFCGAGVNFVANWFLISRLGALGAVIGTLVAELVSCVWQYIKMNRYMSCITTIFKSMIYVVFGVIMFTIVRVVALCFDGGIVALFFEVLTGIITYAVICLIYWKVTKNKIVGLVIKKK